MINSESCSILELEGNEISCLTSLQIVLTHCDKDIIINNYVVSICPAGNVYFVV